MESFDPQIPRLIFDGDCAFCTTTATWVAERLRRDNGVNAELVPWQFTDLEALGVSEDRVRREVLWVDSDGDVSGGAEAFADWLKFRRGPYALVGDAMGLPVVKQLAKAVYRVIAANRSRLPGGTPACALPPPGVTPRH